MSVVRRCLRQTDGNMISVWESVFTTGNPSHPAQWASPQSYPQISCPSQLEASQRRPRGAALPRASSLHKHHQTSLCGANVYGTWPASRGRRYQQQQTESSPVTSQQNTGFEDKIRILICEVRFPWCQRTVTTSKSVSFYQNKAVTVWDQHDPLITLAFFLLVYLKFSHFQSSSLSSFDVSLCCFVIFLKKCF